jgi:outer membrane receptor protein involved in Fe transport
MSIGYASFVRCGVSLLSLTCSNAALAQVTAAQTAQVPQAAGQAATPPTGSTLASPGPADTAPAKTAEDIIVTGSRVITNGNSAPTPVTVATAQDLLERAPSSIPDALNQLPQFAGSGSPARNSYNLPGSIQTGNNLNLRNLGPQRVLTLFDGLRIVPSASSGLVDSSLIPQLLIQRVDIVTGGASAAYGSDAVSGVVNFVLDKKFDGLSYVAQGGVSSRGDYGSQRIGAAVGHQFGRLHVEASAEYYNNDGIGSINDRPNGDKNYADVAVGSNGAAGSATNPYTLMANLQSQNIGFGGYLYNPSGGTNTGVLFNTGGQQRQPVAGATYYNASAFCVNCNTATNDTALIALVPRIQTDQYFARADYALNDAISIFAQGYYGHAASSQLTGATISRTGSTAFPIYAGNAYLPATAVAPSAGSITSPLTTPAYMLSRVSRDLGTNSVAQDGKSYGGTGGLTGSIFGRFKWDVDYSYGRSERTVVASVVDNVRLRAAVDAVSDGSGNIVCRVTITNPGLYPGCTPINLFGEGAPSAAAVNYIRGQSIQTAVFTQSVIEGNLRGTLFNLPYGVVSVAIGGASRRQTYDQTSNSDPAAFVTPAGIRGFTGTEFIGVNYGTGRGKVTVNEGYGEILVPILKDVPFFRQLDLNGAYRYTDYSTSGGVSTWKGGLVWSPISGLKLRGARSRDIRAPTLVELFSGAQVVNGGTVADPHLTTAAAPSFIQTTVGNPNLKPEEADTITLGAVFEPHFLRGFSLSVDYYNIKVKNAIGSLSVPQILSLCEASGGTDVSCGLITRPNPFSDRSAANALTAVTVQPLNSSETDIAGFDIEANYRHALGAGALNLRALVNVPTEYKSRTAANLPFVDYLGNFDQLPSATQALTAITNYHATLSAGYALDWMKIRVDEEIISPMKQSIQFFHAGNENNIPAIAYTNLDFSFDNIGKSKASFFINVSNLFDKTAPVINIALPGTSYQTERTLYDVIGRAFTIGVRGKF